MARYAIGDIQGCYSQFTQLVAKIGFNPSIDVLYLVGDLVNRGPESLKVLKWVYKYQDSVISVLGNHDIYLLARYNNLLLPDADETIQDVLLYKDAGKLIDWLRRCPLVFHDSNYILAHAGVYPKLNFNKLLLLNQMFSNCLRSSDYAAFLHKVFGNKPNMWNDDLDLIQQMKFLVNACTRMRFLKLSNYALDYKYKGEVGNHPSELIPWFQAQFDPTISKKIIFGHWASLGFYYTERCIGLDTGCVWGRKLTALNLETHEVIQV
jgi:bis(5'-nucleosyl)-tetraphosphatase (symmetrical)